MSSEALRIASALEGLQGRKSSKSACEAAAELRRLHGENESLHREADKLTAELSAALSEARRQHALIAELVEALHELADLMDAVRSGNYEPDSFTTQPARTALSKAKEQQ